MVPTFHPGDRLLVESLTFRSRAPRVGEIVVAADPRQPSRELVKRIGAVDRGSRSAELAGDATEASTDSRAFGPVPLADIQWRVVGRYWPPRSVLSPQNEAMPSTQAESSAGSM
jgi:nickel-type superoxide dismutase maturation protease